MKQTLDKDVTYMLEQAIKAVIHNDHIEHDLSLNLGHAFSVQQLLSRVNTDKEI